MHDTPYNEYGEQLDFIPIDESPVIPLTRDHLPGLLGDMIEAASVATETSLELPAMFGLVTLATCCAGRYEVEAKTGYREPLNLWGVAALEPANRKSAVLKIMTAPLTEWEQVRAEEMKQEISDKTDEKKRLEARINHLFSKSAKAKTKAESDSYKDDIREVRNELDNLVVPVAPSLWAQDITPEKLGAKLFEHNHRMAILSAEGGIFDLMSGRYSGGVPNLDVFLQGHAGDPVRVDRGSRKSVVMDSPALSLGLSPQPDVINGLASKEGFRGRGLLARFLYFVPASTIGSRTYQTDPVPGGLGGAYSQLLKRLLSVDVDQPYILKLDAGVYEQWRQHALAIEKEMILGGSLHGIMDWAGKLAGATIRLAGILHCAEHDRPETSRISASTMNTAIELANTLQSHALHSFNAMGTDPNVKLAQRIIKWIKRYERMEFTRREVFQAMKGSRASVKRVDDLLPALIILNDHRYLWQVSDDLFRVHPDVWGGNAKS